MRRHEDWKDEPKDAWVWGKKGTIHPVKVQIGWETMPKKHLGSSQ